MKDANKNWSITDNEFYKPETNYFSKKVLLSTTWDTDRKWY
jgi:hypothetical protein